MADINFNITGIENLIDDFKKTRCECDNEQCVNNAAWSGRNSGRYAPRCLLPSASIDEVGKCEDNTDKESGSDQDHYVITGPAIEASVKGQDLLNRVSVFAMDYLRAEGRCQIPKSLLDEINDHLGKPKE